MKTDTPWHGLTPPLAGSLSARRAHAGHPLDFFYAINSDNQLMLLLQLGQEIKEVHELPRLKGLRLQWVEASHSLQVALINRQDVDLFTLLCKDLVFCTSHASSGPEGLDLICARLMKWQRLLSKGGPRLLDAHEIRGLFAELTFLQSELMPKFGPDAVSLWKGPSGFPQDFSADNMVFEIKSHLVGAQQVVRISSPTQLWVDTLRLYLCIYHLTEVSAGGKSLGTLINEIVSTLSPSAAATEEFEEKLISLGYIDLSEYRIHEFAVAKFDVFLVGEGFPRIALPAIKPGIQDLTYGIQLAALSPFSSAISWSDA